MVLMQAYRADRQSRLSLASSSRTCNSRLKKEANLQAALAALCEVLENHEKRTQAKQHQRCLRVPREKVPSLVVAFAKLKQRRRATAAPHHSPPALHRLREHLQQKNDEVLRPPAHVVHDGDDRPQEAAHRAGVAAGARAHARVRRSGLPVYETMRAAQRLAVTQRVTSAPHKHVPRRRTAAVRRSTRS